MQSRRPHTRLPDFPIYVVKDSQYSVWLQTGRPGFDPDWGKGFFLQLLCPTQSPVQWVPGFSPGGKVRPGRDADHSPSSSAEVKNEYELHAAPPPPPKSMACTEQHLDSLDGSARGKDFTYTRQHNRENRKNTSRLQVEFETTIKVVQRSETARPLSVT
jgi:hypothetical protein